MQNQLWSKKLGKVSRGGPPRSAFFVSGNLHVGGCRRFGRRRSQPVSPPCTCRGERGAGRRFAPKRTSGARALCKPWSEQSALCLELVGNRAHGACEWASAAKSSQGRECGGGVLSLDTIAADPPVLIRHAGFLGEQAHSLTHTLARSPPARGVLLLFFLPVLRVSHLTKCASFHPPPRGLSLWLIDARHDMSPLVMTFYFKDGAVVAIGNWVFRVIEYLGNFVPASRDRRLGSIFRHYRSIFLVIFLVTILGIVVGKCKRCEWLSVNL
jgi:hypothetical protein